MSRPPRLWGYRYAPYDGGFFFKISFTPIIIVQEPALAPWGGIGLRYSF